MDHLWSKSTRFSGVRYSRRGSGLFKSPILYWKKELAWKKIEKANFFDEGVEFEGLSLKGSIPLESISFSPDLPIFNDTVNFIDRRESISYFYVEASESFYSYQISLDFLNEDISYNNSEPIMNSVGFKSEQYINEQLGKKPASIKNELLSNDDVVAAYEVRKKLVDKYVKMYTEKYLVIEVKPLTYKFSQNCKVN